ncbi:MAG: tRNA lysidine(34) synthetase TilS, partial [Bacteroidales bacterium]|nr:tRNA lysidine(34) synthetase TilS [Bacteroidales bacterium]
EISLFSDAAKVIEQRFDEIKGMALSILTGGNEIARISIPVLGNFGNEKYWLYLLLEEWGFSPDVVNDIYNSLDSQSGKLFYSSGYELLKDRNYLIIRDISASDTDDIDLNSISVKIYDVTSGFKPLPSNIIFYLDAGLTGENILFRRWRDGDRFNPLGMKGSKKISDFLTDLKRDRFSKEKRIVATTEDDRIICLLGERIDHNYRITQDTRRVLEISLNI